jgi:hypothetical protein
MKFKTKINYTQTRFDVNKLPEYFTGADIKVYENRQHGRFLVVLNFSDEVKNKIFNQKRTISEIIKEVIQGLKDNNLIKDSKNWEYEDDITSEKFEKRCKKLDLNPSWHFFIKIKREVISEL